MFLLGVAKWRAFFEDRFEEPRSALGCRQRLEAVEHHRRTSRDYATVPNLARKVSNTHVRFGQKQRIERFNFVIQSCLVFGKGAIQGERFEVGVFRGDDQRISNRLSTPYPVVVFPFKIAWLVVSVPRDQGFCIFRSETRQGVA